MNKSVRLLSPILMIFVLMFCLSVRAEAETSKWTHKIIHDSLPSYVRVGQFNYVPFDVAVTRATETPVSAEPQGKTASSVPRGGYVELKFVGGADDDVDPSNWFFVITDIEKNEIFRQKGARPSGPPSGHLVRTASATLDITEPVPDTFILRIVHTPGKALVYKVSRAGAPTNP